MSREATFEFVVGGGSHGIVGNTLFVDGSHGEQRIGNERVRRMSRMRVKRKRSNELFQRVRGCRFGVGISHFLCSVESRVVVLLDCRFVIGIVVSKQRREVGASPIVTQCSFSPFTFEFSHSRLDGTLVVEIERRRGGRHWILHTELNTSISKLFLLTHGLEEFASFFFCRFLCFLFLLLLASLNVSKNERVTLGRRQGGEVL